MRLITHNMLASNVKARPRPAAYNRDGPQCSDLCVTQLRSALTARPVAARAQGVKNGFPLKLEATTVETREAEFNPGAGAAARNRTRARR